MAAMTRRTLLAFIAGATLSSLLTAETARSATPTACSLLTDAQVKTLIYRGQPAERPEEMAVGRRSRRTPSRRRREIGRASCRERVL